MKNSGFGEVPFQLRSFSALQSTIDFPMTICVLFVKNDILLLYFFVSSHLRFTFLDLRICYEKPTVINYLIRVWCETYGL